MKKFLIVVSIFLLVVGIVGVLGASYSDSCDAMVKILFMFLSCRIFK